MKSEPHREEALFQAAAQLSGAERASFLNIACHGDPTLRQRLEALLAAHHQPDDLPASAAPAAQATIKLEFADKPVDEAVGQTIGRYKLLQQIGEGGCGVVYMAEQQEPVRRRVALKVIKLGMDTKQVIARFEAERQALALMDHPNIAKVLDAGATETGRPYFVMELVKGIPITRFCDENNLSTVTRLGLFIQVCQAIQHAHQKGIIHRDIKPSNILVADHDGVPVPKIIDFGIAKATTDQRLTDKTLFTAFEQFIGTPAYMSPEQARLSGLDIDTRSDIYSLGVLLYELLTSRTPFEGKRLHEAGLDEIRRIIREEEPVRPSTKLHTLDAAEQTTVAKHRQSDPPRLAHLISGDLDWIVMKALEKDRGRRYETANGLAMDIQRHLNNEPVIACPPSKVYRFRKTVRRNKLAFAAAAAVVGSLAAGMGVSTWLFLKEREAHKKEVAAVEARLREEQRARQQQERAEQEARLRQLGSLTSALVAQEKWVEAESVAREKLALQQKLLGAENLDVADSLIDLGAALMAQHKWTEAETALRAGLTMERHFVKKGNPKLAGPILLLSMMLAYQGRSSDAEGLSREMMGVFQDMGDGVNLAAGARLAQFLPALMAAGVMPSVTSNALGTNSIPSIKRRVDSLMGQGEYEQAEQVFSNHLTPDFLKKPESADLLKARGDFLARRSRWKDAVADFSKLIDVDPNEHWYRHCLAPLLVQSDDLEGYRRHCTQVLAILAGTTNPVVAERMAKDCLILPAAGIDLEAVARLADTAVTRGKGHEYFAYFEFAKGLAEYRQKHFTSAIDWMQKVLAEPGVDYRDAQAYLVLAMAQQRSGQANEARAALAKGAEIIETKMPKLESGDIGEDWTDWIIAHALLKEAKTWIE